jgi:hypothetical protein
MPGLPAHCMAANTGYIEDYHMQSRLAILTQFQGDKTNFHMDQ